MKQFFCVFLIFFGLLQNSSAAMRVAIDGVVWQNSFSNPSAGANTGNQTLGKLSLSGPLSNKNKLWLGWQFLSFSSVIKGVSESSKISTFDMGPHFVYDFGSDKLYSLGFFYGIKNTTSFDDGTSSVALSGSSMNLSFSLNPMISENVSLMVGLNYYLANYTLSTVDNIQTSVSYSFKNLIPTLGIKFIL